MNSKIINEVIRFELKNPDTTISSDKTTFPDHLHDFYEICIVLNDCVKFITEKGNYLVSAHNLLVIPPFCFHHAVTKKENQYKRLILWFKINKSDKFLPITSLLNEHKLYDFTYNKHIVNLIDSFSFMLENIESSFLIDITESFLTQLLFLLKYSGQNDFTQTYQSPIISQILNYIDKNIFKKITITDIAEHIHISTSSLQKSFKKIMHYSVIDFIREKKMLTAKNLILDGFPPTEVCYQIGYNDYSSFYKAFTRQFGISPKMIKNL